jgi:hypothetical protein
MTYTTQELRTAYTDFLSRYPFEWFATLTFKNEVSPQAAKKHFLKWVRKLCIGEHLRVAALIIYNRASYPHLHALMLGRNRDGKTLNDASIERWQEEWSSYRYGCKIRQVYDLEGASRYIAKNIATYQDNLYELFSYNKKLLKKTATRQVKEILPQLSSKRICKVAA